MMRICGLLQRNNRDHLDPFDLGYDDAMKGDYENPFDKSSDEDAYYRYDLGFETGMNAK